MALAVDVVKRGGHRPSEAFNADKLQRSIYAACLSVRTPAGEAESAAGHVTRHIIIWLQNRPVVTSRDLRHLASLHLERYHPEAAYFYQHHQAII